MPLSQQDKKRLRRIGHHLKPVLISGDKGLTETFLEELEGRLEDHELIKVKINDDQALSGLMDHASYLKQCAGEH